MTLIDSTCIRVAFLIQSFFKPFFEIVLEELEDGVLECSSLLLKRVLLTLRRNGESDFAG
jgi:hypothetical protein